MVKNWWIILLLALFPYGLMGQDTETDFELLADKAVKKMYQYPDDCIGFTQSLSISNHNAEHRMILQNVMAQAQAMKGDYVQSVKFSLEEENFGNTKEISPFATLFLNYNLAEQYQNLRLYDQSAKIIQNSLRSHLVTFPKTQKTALTVAKLYQLNALNHAVTKEYKTALKIFETSNQYLTFPTNENLIIHTENDLYRIIILLNQSKINDAKIAIQPILKRVQTSDLYFLYALSHEINARICFAENRYQEAVKNLDLALESIRGKGFMPMEGRIYESYARNFSALKDSGKYQQYTKLYLGTKTKLESNKREGIRYLLKLVEIRENQIYLLKQRQENRFTYTVTGIFAVFCISLLLYDLSVKSKSYDLKKQLDFFEKQKKIDAQLKQKTISVGTHKTKPTPHSELPKNEKKTPVISREKEDEILDKLKEFEQSERFLNKNMSLANLAGQMDTNTRYLSEVINKYKGKNFNLYINELRINHIAYILKTNPTYLNYKVSYLAEACGFSSHSSFTTVFKSITGMSPNAYIQQIQNKVL